MNELYPREPEGEEAEGTQEAVDVGGGDEDGEGSAEEDSTGDEDGVTEVGSNG